MQLPQRSQSQTDWGVAGPEPEGAGAGVKTAVAMHGAPAPATGGAVVVPPPCKLLYTM